MPFLSHPEPKHSGDEDATVPSGASVLILDEDTGLRTALKNNFVRHGWSVRTASSFDEALRVIEQHVFDLVVSGLATGDGDMDALMAAQREFAPATRTIVLIPNIGISDVVQVMRAGAFDVLSRDTPFDALQASARSAIQGLEGIRPKAQDDALSPIRSGGMTLSQLNRKCLEDALALADGNRTNAARMLGISVRTVRNKIRQYGLPPRSYV